MKIYNDINEFKARGLQLSLALGTFDGFHLGHRQVIENMKGFAQKHNLETAVFAFSNIPKNVKNDFSKPKVSNILEIEDKLEMAKMMGVKHFFNIRFSQELKNMSREDFLKLLIKQLNVKAISVGFNFRFGKGAQGNTEWLKKRSKKSGIRVVICDEISYDDQAISSTRIRHALRIGNVEFANRLLGYPYFVRGTVAHGLKNGRKLGFPTANLSGQHALELLKKGVYISDVIIDEKKYRGVSNLGYKPTFGEHDLSLETHIVGFEGDLYEREIRVEFLKMIRPEMKFNSFEELKSRIDHDRNLAMRYE